MPRNGSGTHSIPNSFSSGTTIESSAMNANFSDVASEITGSLPRDGQAAMTGQLKAASGTVGAPGITFGADSDTGFYRKSSNTIGVVVGGAEIGTISSTGITNAAGAILGPSIPTGTAMLFVQAAAPTGWTRVTTHNDKALRIVSSVGGGSGGGTAFSSVFTNRTILEANLPSHTHSFSATTSSSGAHQHTYTAPNTSSTNTTTGGGGSRLVDAIGTLTDSQGTHTHTVSGTTGSIGSGTAMNFAVQYVDALICTKDA